MDEPSGKNDSPYRLRRAKPLFTKVMEKNIHQILRELAHFLRTGSAAGIVFTLSANSVFLY
jgi:hypothetical protein